MTDEMGITVRAKCFICGWSNDTTSRIELAAFMDEHAECWEPDGE